MIEPLLFIALISATFIYFDLAEVPEYSPSFFLAAIVLFSFADVVTTDFGLWLGGEETNPLAIWIWDTWGREIGYLVRVALGALFGSYFYWLSWRHPTGEIGLIILSYFYGSTIVWNMSHIGYLLVI